MALTGQLSDMSLAELIEFFCNQRKTGRLKVDYHRGHGVFYIKEGELVDAKVGALSGAAAVYFALTLPNAAFDFSGDIEPPRITIKDSWTQVVLEGLRRLDEGVSPSESDAFGGGWSPSDADLAMFMDHVERLGEGEASSANGNGANAKRKEEVRESAAPFSMMVENAEVGGGSKKKFMFAGIGAAVVLVCLVVAIPLSRSGNKETSSANAAPAASQPVAPAATAPEATAPDSAAQPVDAVAATDPTAEAALAARREARERADRERDARERARKAEEAKQLAANGGATPTEAPKPAVPAPAAASGPKSVRVSVTYDENGRVTAASVAGASAGAESFGGTAVRIARGKRFPAGKAGSSVVTIPVN